MNPTYKEHWNRVADRIRERIAEFEAVPEGEYLFELAYCLLTPQSRALHAGIVVDRLREAGWPEVDVDPVSILRDPANYIRFHNVKSERLRRLRTTWPEIEEVLQSGEDSREIRRRLVDSVNGLGMKEASHFLRNIGHLDLAIIDRHILKHLAAVGAIDAIPTSITPSRYLSIEHSFLTLARSWSLSLQQLDLLLWSLEEGTVRK